MKRFIFKHLWIIEIVKAGQQFLEKDSNIKVAKVEGPENPGLLKKMNVTGYPTLFYYRNADDASLRTEELYQPIKYEGKSLLKPLKIAMIWMIHLNFRIENSN